MSAYSTRRQRGGTLRNGTRCAAAYLHYAGLWTAKELRLSTRTGVKRYFLREQFSDGKYLFDSELAILSLNRIDSNDQQ